MNLENRNINFHKYQIALKYNIETMSERFVKHAAAHTDWVDTEASTGFTTPVA